MPKDQTLIVEAVELQLLQIAHTHATNALPCSLTSSATRGISEMSWQTPKQQEILA